MAEEARDETKTIPAAINRVRIAVFAIYFTLPAVALSALPVHAERQRRVPDAARADRGAGRLRRRPDPRRRQADRPRAAAERRRRSTSACWRPRSSSWPPTRASSASRGSSTRWASTASCPTRCASCTRSYRTPWIGILVFSGDRDRGDPAGPGGLPRQPLRVRRAALVHDRARRRWCGCGRRSRTSRGPTAARATSRIRGYDAPLFAIVGGTFTAIAFVVIVVLQPERGGRSASAGCCSGSSSTSPSAAARGST